MHDAAYVQFKLRWLNTSGSDRGQIRLPDSEARMLWFVRFCLNGHALFVRAPITQQRYSWSAIAV